MKAARLALLWAWVASSALGCGHEATREECEEILALSAALALHADDVTDAELVRERTENFRDLRGAELLQGCVGKRIPEGAMKCMRVARSAEEFDDCLD